MSTLGTKTKPYIKDPNAVLDYIVDWTSFLAGDTIPIGGSTWVVQSGITKDTDTRTTTSTTIWLSGGTLGQKYALTNRIATAGGRVEDRTIYVKVKEL